MYGYQQPYYQQSYYQQPQQVQPVGVPGRIVGDFSEIKIMDIPTDGSWAYFIKADGSEIQGRRWSENGQVVPVSFSRIDQEQKVDPIQERLNDLEERLDRIEKSRNRRKENADE